MRRPWLLPFTPLYAAIVAWKNARFESDANRSAKLKWPVISVGGISAGGSGKTPAVAALVPLLRDAGYLADILSRGYRRNTSGTLRVDPHGDAARFGDEPLMLARSTGAPVYVSAGRVHAGRLAEIELDIWQKRAHLLDDGFQHRHLARDIDIVLFTGDDARDTLLPAGNLREPLRALRRAGIIVLREDESADLLPVAQKHAQQGCRFWTIRRSLHMPTVSQHPFAFCAIARPEDFFSQLNKQGIRPIRTMAFRDHHRYTDADIDRMLREASNAGGWITTAKDAVKLTPRMLEKLNAHGPLAIADLHVEFCDRERAVRDLQEMLQAATRGRSTHD